MKQIFLTLFTFIAMNTFAQKTTYDIVSYEAPSGWKSEEADTYITYSKIDGGSWSQIAIYKSTASKGDIMADLNSEWTAIVEPLRTLSKIETTKPATADGWTVVSRSGVWPYKGTNVASLLTVYSNGSVCVSILCNATAQPYLKNYQTLIGSVDLKAPAVAAPANVPNTTGATTTTANNSSIVGLWGIYVNEVAYYANGTPMLSGGFFRKEYTFYNNGTYKFMEKDFSAYNANTILFGWETGTWSISGDQLMIKPVRGEDQNWSKAANGKTDQWGKMTKKTTRPLETVSYTFNLKFYSGQNETHLALRNTAPTHREGKSNNFNGGMHEWSYVPRALEKAMVIPPPGTVVN